MASYLVRVRTPRSPEDAFAYMAHLVHFAAWDPGVISAEQIAGDGPGPDAAYDVRVKGMRAPLRYRTTRYEPTTTVVVRAESRLLTSLDTITVATDGTGSLVTYDAALTLNGPLGLADPLVAVGFRRIAGRAADGLIRALDGVRVDA